MQLGMIGLGRMGASMVRRLLRRGHACVVHDRVPAAVEALTALGATGAASLRELVEKLATPRVVWLMVPAAAVDPLLEDLTALLGPGDVVIDGGNSHYRDDIRRARELDALRVRYVDVGTSGGIAGEARGYCLMIGGEPAVVRHLDPIFAALAPGLDAVRRSPARSGATTKAEEGYLHCGPPGAGHFVKMVHNGIEYGLMAAYAEGLNILKNANAGARTRTADAETTPLRDPGSYRYDLNLADITEVWRRGSVVASWLLDLAADALARDPQLAGYGGRVSDSGEGRWTLEAAIDEGVPAHVLAAALFARFDSRGEAVFANQVLSALRHGFGGHAEKPPEGAR